MLPIVLEMGRVAIFTAIPLAICILIEFGVPKTRYAFRDRFPGAFFILIPPVFGVVAIIPLSALWHSLGVEPLFHIAHWPVIVTFVAMVLYRDFLNYWQHRLDHLLLWPIHSVHHSVRDLHAANGFTHPFQSFTEFLYMGIPLSLVDFGPIELPMAVTILISVQSMIIHSPIRLHLGPLRYIFVDSPFHRVHHSIEERHYNLNFGTIFSFWDILFRSAYFPAKDEWAVVGVTGLKEPQSLKDYLTLPLEHFRRDEVVGASMSGEGIEAGTATH